MVQAKQAGYAYMSFAVSVFLYYTVWILVTPIIDSNHPVQSYFPDRESGLLVTTFGAYVFLSFLCTFAGVILINDKPLPDVAQTQSHV
jgi:dolichol phosphate-mannose biosynthesis regulatory protein